MDQPEENASAKNSTFYQDIVDIIGSHLTNCKTLSDFTIVGKGFIEDPEKVKFRDLIVQLLGSLDRHGTYKGQPLIVHYLRGVAVPDKVILKAFKNIDWNWKWENNGYDVTVAEYLLDFVNIEYLRFKVQTVLDMMLEGNTSKKEDQLAIKCPAKRQMKLIYVSDLNNLVLGPFHKIIDYFLVNSKTNELIKNEVRRQYPHLPFQIIAMPLFIGLEPIFRNASIIPSTFPVLFNYFDYEINDCYNGQSLLHWIISTSNFKDKENREECEIINDIQFLVKFPGLDLNQKCIIDLGDANHAMTPLELSLRLNSFQIAVELIRAGALVSEIDPNYSIPIKDNPPNCRTAIELTMVLGFNRFVAAMQGECDHDGYDHEEYCAHGFFLMTKKNVELSQVKSRMVRPLLELAALAIRGRMSEDRAHRYFQALAVKGKVIMVPDHISKIFKLQHRTYGEKNA